MDIGKLIEEGKIKRLFRARNKISYPGAICHITQRAAGKEPLFLEDSDYLYMLHILKEQKKKFNFDIFCYSLMPNHLHILLRLSKDNLSDAMKELYRRYARFFNKKYGRKGHVFGGPFRQSLCFNETYLLAASLYIHLNAVRANLVRDPEKYRWSDCKLYLKPFKGTTFIDYKFILGILDDNIKVAQKIYKEMLDDSIAVKAEEVWENPKALEFFKIEVMNFLPKSIKEKKDREDFQYDVLDEHKLEEKIAELKTKGRLRTPETINARKFLIEQLRARGYSFEVITKMLDISRQAIYLTLQN